MERKIVGSDLTLSDGTHIPQGNWTMIAQHAVMRDPGNYSDPEIFDPSRFITQAEGIVKSQTRLSHPSYTFPFWGSVARPWYVDCSPQN